MPGPNTPSSARLLNLAVHELRTPASIVGGYLRMLLAGHAGPLTDKQHKMLTEAVRATDRLTALVAEMSEISNLDAGTLALPRQRVVIVPLLQEAAAGLGETSDGGARVEVRLAEGIEAGAIVLADSVRLRAAVVAVLTALAREQADAAPLVLAAGIEQAGDPPAIVVRIGEREALADPAGPPAPFDEWRGGVGLALPIARRVIEAAGGRIWSAPARASRPVVGIALPLATPDA